MMKFDQNIHGGSSLRLQEDQELQRRDKRAVDNQNRKFLMKGEGSAGGMAQVTLPTPIRKKEKLLKSASIQLGPAQCLCIGTPKAALKSTYPKIVQDCISSPLTMLDVLSKHKTNDFVKTLNQFVNT